MPYIAKLEKAGIPTVTIDFADQDNMMEQESLAQGVPNIRYIHASRTVPGPEDVEDFVEPMLEMLTVPLTKEEKESGRLDPSQERILFEGTYDEAEEFFNQTEWIPSPVNAPISVYTDGYPVRIPTEERVREMLTGTSHNPDEIITYQSDRIELGGNWKKGEPVQFHPMKRTATVEQVAVNAVMAGCKPEHLPVVLAIAESKCQIGSTHTFGQFMCVSGPFAKEVGMSSGCGMLGPGNPANAAIGRTYELIARNLGGAIPGVNRMTSIGSALEGSRCCAENADGLPPGWKGLNEEFNFSKDKSVVLVINHVNDGIRGVQHSPGGYRALQKSGHGGMARRLGVKGIPGPHNWLEYVLPEFWAGREGPKTIIMIPEMARHLYEYGFKSKEEVYEWLWEKSFVTVKQYKEFSWVDLTSNGWMGIEPISEKHWKELPDDHMVPAGGNSPSGFCIIVGGGEEEVAHQLCGHRAGTNPVYSIDAWR
ncbi:hypothetical protein ACFLWR_06970 [Chloroflexota bacterium]